ncbi:hypothetical protein LEMLEM_LOCUS18505 [Lemmus lemmus]
MVRVSRRVGWVADIAADPVRSAPAGSRRRRDHKEPPRARRRDDARGALRTVRPDPGTPEGGGRWESGRAVGGAARPPFPDGGREESAATGIRFPRPRDSASCSCRGAVTLGAGWFGAHGWRRPPRATFPAGAFPAVPEPVAAHRRRWKCARRRPVAGHGAVPRRPHPRPRPRAAPAPPRGRGRGETDARVEGSGGTGSGKDPPGAARPDARRRVESSGRTARTPPVYLLTVSRPLELSLQSSFQLSLTQPDSGKTRARRAGGRYRPHTVHGLGLDQKDLGPPRAAPGSGSSVRHISRAAPRGGDSALGSSLFTRRY